MGYSNETSGPDRDKSAPGHRPSRWKEKRMRKLGILINTKLMGLFMPPSYVTVKYATLASLITIGCCLVAPVNSHADLTRTVKQWQPLKNHPAFVAFSHDGSRLAVSNILSKDIKIFSVPDIKLIHQMGKSGSIEAIAFSPDNKTLATGCSFSRLIDNRNSLRLWEFKSGRIIWEPPGFISGKGPENDVVALVFDPTGKNLLASLEAAHNRNHLLLIDLKKKTYKEFGTESATSIAFSKTGDRIVSAGYDGIQMWSKSGDGPLWKLSFQSGNNLKPRINMIAFSPNGTQLMVSAEKSVTIHNAKDGRLLNTLPITMHLSRTFATYTPDGKYIVAASDRLWILEAQSLRVLEESKLPKAATSLSYSPTGNYFAVGTGSGYVVLKELKIP